MRLQQRFDLLDHAQLAATERHSTLSDLVGWSFNLLTVEEQTLFSRLAVFAGGFGLDAAEGVCADHDAGDGTLGTASVARVLAGLVDKSMVQVTDAEIGRYRVLEPLREYGRAHAGDRADVSRRHVRHATRPRLRQLACRVLVDARAQ